MNAFLFTGWISEFNDRRGLVDSCVTLIVAAGDEAAARSWFEAALLSRNQSPEARGTKIEQIVASPIAENLLTEDGPERIDWARLCAEAEAALLAAEADYEQQGYWVDCNSVVSPASPALSVGALRDALPEEIRSGVNWSADRQNFFLVSALCVAPAPGVGDDPAGCEAEDTANEPATDAGADESGSPEMHRRAAPFPELSEREATAVVKARNTVVAAWLWRRYAAQTRLADNAIRVDSWCGAVNATAPASGAAAVNP